ncbi:hypothetical protein ACIBG8_05680 [Nonomuraea sp. NPDC050556]|uniref:hypothetical protein n=1 Tax=Nonomuraea sp. NPDC050556 TaxID=3364369 RepID=UPI00379B1B3A
MIDDTNGRAAIDVFNDRIQACVAGGFAASVTATRGGEALFAYGPFVESTELRTLEGADEGLPDR